MAIKSPISNPLDNLFEQMANISKAGAYDIVANQRNELLAENETLKQQVKELRETLELAAAYRMQTHYGQDSLCLK